MTRTNYKVPGYIGYAGYTVPDASQSIPAGEISSHAVTSDTALYYAYVDFLAAMGKYHTYAIAHDSSRAYGPSFMNYLAGLSGSAGMSFDDLIDTLYFVSSGSTVTDVMGGGTDSEGNAYDFDFINDLNRIDVRLNGVTFAKTANADGSYSFYKDGDEAAAFKLVYDSISDSFTFTINTNITVMDELQIIYDVQLTNPQQNDQPGTFGELHTNDEAILHPVDSQGNAGADQTFPDPVLFYENPDIDKLIAENGAEVASNDVSIGDAITYKVPISIPENVFDADLVVTDIIGKGLTPDTAITADQGVGGLTFTKGSSADSNSNVYSVTIPGSTVKANAGKTLTLTYTAVLNTDAVIDGAGNKNTVRLDYNVHDVAYNGKTLAVDIRSAEHTVVTYTHKISISKTDEEGQPLAAVKFTLQNTDGKYYRTKSGTTSVWADSKSELTSPADGTITFDGLDQGSYTLTETGTPSGYNPLSASIIITVDEDGNVTERHEHGDDVRLKSGVISIKNTLRKVKVRFRKADAFDLSIGLGGAGFTAAWGGEEYSLTSAEDGLLKTADGTSQFELAVSSSPYTLAETDPPTGYYPLAGTVLIYVSAEGVTAGSSDDPGTNYSVTEEGGIYTVTIPNRTSVVLPETGGSGTAFFYLLGLVLICLAGAGLLLRRRWNSAA